MPRLRLFSSSAMCSPIPAVQVTHGEALQEGDALGRTGGCGFDALGLQLAGEFVIDAEVELPELLGAQRGANGRRRSPWRASPTLRSWTTSSISTPPPASLQSLCGWKTSTGIRQIGRASCRE